MDTTNIDDNHSKRNSLAPFLEAIHQFRTRFYKDEPEIMRKLLDYGQKPIALMISCSDSRVDPALLVNAGPGDLFVVRNVANLVPPYHISQHPDSIGTAIEYAVRDLKVSHIIVMGHAHCGGIKALLNNVSGQQLNRDYIGNWVAIAENACRLHTKTPQGTSSSKTMSLEQLKEYPYLVERAAIMGSLKNLLTYPWIKSAIDEGGLSLHGWWFDLETGDLWSTDQEMTQFMPVF